MTNRYAVEVIDGTLVDDEVAVPMEPGFKTEPRLAGVAEELRSREPLFHREGAGVSHEDRMRGTAPDFWEVGASGRRYGRDYVLETLEEATANRRETSGTSRTFRSGRSPSARTWSPIRCSSTSA